MKNLYLNNNAKSLDIEDNSVDLIITHPPYFGIDYIRYGGNIKQQINYKNKKMINELIKITYEMKRVLKDTGNFFICIGPGNGMPFKYISKVLEKNIFFLKDILIFNYSKSKNQEDMNKDLMIWFHLVKNVENSYFNPFEIKKDSSALYSCNENNFYHPVDIILKDKFPNANLLDSLDIILCDKIINMYSKPKDIVLDPMGGTGVVAMSSLKNNRTFIYNDVSELQIKIAKQRLSIFENKKEREGKNE